MPRILILSPYDALSHRQWRLGLERYLKLNIADVEVVQVSLPARFYSWRQRGNSLSLAYHPTLRRDFDLIIATSMTDLSALRGLNRQLAVTPVILYFHENQFAYPDSHEKGLLERQLTSIYSALSADAVFFNSAYNRQTFIEGATELLAKMPDGVPGGVLESIAEGSRIVPVALDPAPNLQPAAPLRDIVWNHRWEHDKGPDLLLDIVTRLIDEDLPFRMSLFGQAFKQVPAPIQQVIQHLGDNNRLLHAGFVAFREEYLRQLSRHQIVLSTARHEFQGLAVQEAMNLGCYPVVPDSLCYPEYVPDGLRYTDADDAVRILRSLLKDSVPAGSDPAPPMSSRWESVGPAWLDQIQQRLVMAS